jgi:hypothetical protein
MILIGERMRERTFDFSFRLTKINAHLFSEFQNWKIHLMEPVRGEDAFVCVENYEQREGLAPEPLLCR